ncbi:MAG: hypothetical protein HYV13_02995 [Candidatus Doudnabacteria bacterium]|nr:hypothetical protein [Candidatus Doudnabacteria bacterium]
MDDETDINIETFEDDDFEAQESHVEISASAEINIQASVSGRPVAEQLAATIEAQGYAREEIRDLNQYRLDAERGWVVVDSNNTERSITEAIKNSTDQEALAEHDRLLAELKTRNYAIQEGTLFGKEFFTVYYLEGDNILNESFVRIEETEPAPVDDMDDDISMEEETDSKIQQSRLIPAVTVTEPQPITLNLTEAIQAEVSQEVEMLAVDDMDDDTWLGEKTSSQGQQINTELPFVDEEINKIPQVVEKSAVIEIDRPEPMVLNFTETLATQPQGTIRTESKVQQHQVTRPLTDMAKSEPVSVMTLGAEKHFSEPPTEATKQARTEPEQPHAAVDETPKTEPVESGQAIRVMQSVHRADQETSPYLTTFKVELKPVDDAQETQPNLKPDPIFDTQDLEAHLVRRQAQQTETTVHLPESQTQELLKTVIPEKFIESAERRTNARLTVIQAEQPQLLTETVEEPIESSSQTIIQAESAPKLKAIESNLEESPVRLIEIESNKEIEPLNSQIDHDTGTVPAENQKLEISLPEIRQPASTDREKALTLGQAQAQNKPIRAQETLQKTTVKPTAEIPESREQIRRINTPDVRQAAAKNTESKIKGPERRPSKTSEAPAQEKRDSLNKVERRPGLTRLAKTELKPEQSVDAFTPKERLQLTEKRQAVGQNNIQQRSRKPTTLKPQSELVKSSFMNPAQTTDVDEQEEREENLELAIAA